MNFHIWHLWRTMTASRNVHPIFAGRVHRNPTRLRRFGEIVIDLIIVALVLMPVLSMPLYAGILGYFALNQTRNLIYRVGQMGLYDLVAVTAAGHVVTLWQCFAAWFHIYTDTRRFRFIYVLVLAGAAVLMVAFSLPGLLSYEPVETAALVVLLVCTWVFMALDAFLSIGLAGLLALLSAAHGVNPGTRLVAEMSYLTGKALMYTVAYVVGITLGNALNTWTMILAPALLLVYIAIHEGLYRILWRLLRQRTDYEYARLRHAALW